MLPFLLLLGKFSGFGGLWASNHEWRPNMYRVGQKQIYSCEYIKHKVYSFKTFLEKILLKYNIHTEKHAYCKYTAQ